VTAITGGNRWWPNPSISYFGGGPHSSTGKKGGGSYLYRKGEENNRELGGSMSSFNHVLLKESSFLAVEGGF